jgi:hypothetical protein
MTPRLDVHGRDVRTPFGLLGTSENALTFSLGFTFQQCPRLLKCFLRDVGIAGVRPDLLRSARIYLQRTSSAEGRDITDVEIQVPGLAHVIIEAKIGLSVPTLSQCLQYLPRFNAKKEPQQKLVALVESPATNFIEQYQADKPELRSLLVGYVADPHSSLREAASQIRYYDRGRTVGTNLSYFSGGRVRDEMLH